METYILQVVLFQLLFLGVYEILLKKETFFSYNRWYLLATSVISLLLPLIKIEALAFLLPAETISGISTVWLPEVFIGEATEASTSLNKSEAVSNGTNINLWQVCYAAGLLVSLFIFFKKFQNLNRLFRYRTLSAERNFRIIEVPNSTIACTFYKTIFLGDKLSEAERQQILTHELVHVKQKHSLDLIFFEIYKIVFWFNPLIYIYQNRIRSLHEFIADAAVVKDTEKRSYYEQLLNSAFNTQNISFINQFFNHSLIKKRIVMIQRSRSKSISKARYLIVIPIILAMLTIVACSDSLVPLPSSDPNLEKYNYTLVRGEEESSNKDAENYQNFLEENPDYVGWQIVDHEKKIIEYSVHSKDEEVPKDYKKLEYLAQNGEKLFRYVKGVTTDVNTAVAIKEDNINVEGVADIPFAVIDQVPVFPGCENFSSNAERKECMVEKINGYVMTNFNTGLGKQLGLDGIIRVITVFKINPQGQVTEVRARAPHPDLEAEAIRVISSLPEMTPGKHTGKEVGVSYSLPIVFQVNK